MSTTTPGCPILGPASPVLGWAFAKRTALLVLASAASPLFAQTAPCALTTLTDTAPLLYPPIARQAHIEGKVILLATFNLDGTVKMTKIIGGSELLRRAATDYVQHLQASPYTGPRECPIVIDFRIIPAPPCENSSETRFERLDPQHVQLSTGEIWLCDPTAVTVRRYKRFLFF